MSERARPRPRPTVVARRCRRDRHDERRGAAGHRRRRTARSPACTRALVADRQRRCSEEAGALEAGRQPGDAARTRAPARVEVEWAADRRMWRSSHPPTGRAAAPTAIWRRKCHSPLPAVPASARHRHRRRDVAMPTGSFAPDSPSSIVPGAAPADLPPPSAGSHRRGGRRGRAELAGHEPALERQAGHEAEDRQQAVAGPATPRLRRGAARSGRRPCSVAEVDVRAGPRRVGPDQRDRGRRRSADAGAGRRRRNSAARRLRSRSARRFDPTASGRSTATSRTAWPNGTGRPSSSSGVGRHAADQTSRRTAAETSAVRLGAVDDLVRAMLIALGVLVVLGLALVGFLMWRFKIPPRGVVAMFGALLYLALPIDVVPEALLGPIGLVDDAGVVAVVAIWVYKLVKARQKLVDGGVSTADPSLLTTSRRRTLTRRSSRLSAADTTPELVQMRRLAVCRRADATTRRCRSVSPRTCPRGGLRRSGPSPSCRPGW